MAPATRCGCGGAGGSGGGCSCGGAGCATCRPDGFVYPRFFAGELLTEDDLSLLVEYVVAKNRLHNRALFGDGVVCGLDVTCHPCDPGKVIVQPGYALDCCGNDILVPCPQELDINAMVRDLRRHVKGDFDCTDPCMDRASSGANSLTNRAGANASAIFVPPVRKYCLYVRFCEQLSDPVAAYATDGSCPPQPCEPTRVREGFRFELRCPAPEREDDNVVRHFLQCAQDMITAEQSLSEGVILSPQVGRLDAATRAALTEAVPTFDATQEQALVTATARLTQALDLLSKLPPVTSGGPDSSPSLLDAVDAAREVGGLLTRLTMSTQVASLQQSKALAAERSAALAQIRRADAALADQALAAIPTPLDRDFALATMAAVRAFATADAATLASGSIEPRLFAEGAVWNARYETAFAGALSRLQSTLRLQMEKAPHPTLCSLNQIVTTTTVPTPPTPTGTILLTTQYVRPAAYVSASSQLLAAASRWWLECLCLSLNPPCQPCDDPARAHRLHRRQGLQRDRHLQHGAQVRAHVARHAVLVRPRQPRAADRSAVLPFVQLLDVYGSESALDGGTGAGEFLGVLAAGARLRRAGAVGA